MLSKSHSLARTSGGSSFIDSQKGTQTYVTSVHWWQWWIDNDDGRKCYWITFLSYKRSELKNNLHNALNHNLHIARYAFQSGTWSVKDKHQGGPNLQPAATDGFYEANCETTVPNLNKFGLTLIIMLSMHKKVTKQICQSHIIPPHSIHPLAMALSINKQTNHSSGKPPSAKRPRKYELTWTCRRRRRKRRVSIRQWCERKKNQQLPINIFCPYLSLPPTGPSFTHSVLSH